MEHKIGVIRTLRHRADHIISEEEDKVTEHEHLKIVLSIAGYTKWAWQIPARRNSPLTPVFARTLGLKDM